MLARAVLPSPVKRLLRSAHRDLTFRRSLARLADDPAAVADDPDTLDALIYGWGNEGFSALHEYLRQMIHTASTLPVHGDILECGSGLSTVVLAAVAGRTGRHVVALEHIPSWASRVRRALENGGFQQAATVTDAPLVAQADTTGVTWYDYAPDRPFALVVCDGPPSTTEGGRYGMLPALRGHLAPGSTVLLDDLERPDEQAILAQWTAETGGQADVRGTTKPFGVLRLPT